MEEITEKLTEKVLDTRKYKMHSRNFKTPKKEKKKKKNQRKQEDTETEKNK
jgi:hypothetical protein